MPLTSIGRTGKKTQKLGEDAMFAPAVFEIICEKSKRRLVGASDAPNLRKSVYFYWLQNITTYSNANVWFGSKEVQEDLAEHGFDSFYFEIVRQLPADSTPRDIESARLEHMLKYKPHQLYNRVPVPTSRGTSYKVSRFAHLEPEVAKLEEQRKECIKKVVAINKEYTDARKAARANRAKVMTDESIPTTARARLIRAVSARWKELKPQLDLAKYELHMVESAIRGANVKFIIKYKELAKNKG